MRKVLIKEDGKFDTEALYHHTLPSGDEALVELKDGSMKKIPITEIKFIDSHPTKHIIHG